MHRGVVSDASGTGHGKYAPLGLGRRVTMGQGNLHRKGLPLAPELRRQGHYWPAFPYFIKTIPALHHAPSSGDCQQGALRRAFGGTWRQRGRRKGFELSGGGGVPRGRSHLRRRRGRRKVRAVTDRHPLLYGKSRVRHRGRVLGPVSAKPRAPLACQDQLAALGQSCRSTHASCTHVPRGNAPACAASVHRKVETHLLSFPFCAVRLECTLGTAGSNFRAQGRRDAIADGRLAENHAGSIRVGRVGGCGWGTAEEEEGRGRTLVGFQKEGNSRLKIVSELAKIIPLFNWQKNKVAGKMKLNSKKPTPTFI